MKFRVYEEGSTKTEKEIDVPSEERNPRARAAALFIGKDPYRYPGVESITVVVCPLDEEADNLPGWIPSDETNVYPWVVIKVRPHRTITWSAVQVQGRSNGVIADGERFTIEVG